MKKDTKLWIVGKVGKKNYLEWQFQGVFSELEKAVSACKDEDYFIGLSKLNMEYNTGESVDWPGAYYPKRKK